MAKCYGVLSIRRDGKGHREKEYDIARERESGSREKRGTKKCVEWNRDKGKETKGKRGKESVRTREREGKGEKERETYYIGCFEGAWAFSQRVRSFGEGALVGDKRETYEG